MPYMDGFEVCKRLKADGHLQHIPIILITALDSKEDLARGLAAGAEDFLSKPVSSIELQARVRAMLRIKEQHDLLNNQYQKLEAVMQLREDLTQMIMHDLRSPLTAILGFSELLILEKDQLQPNQARSLEIIHTESTRLNAFINDLLLCAKMEQDQLILHRSLVDLNQLINYAGQTYERLGTSKQVTYRLDLPTETRPVLLDKNLFQRVLDNLLANALKFSPSDSIVTVRVEYPAGSFTSTQVRLQIADTGPGIAPEDRERIFDKFGVLSSKQMALSQIGLGLAFVKMVILAHGGRIFVEPNKPVGSIFTIEL
jgi:signal transduction histidine kinase